jgi:hypothetical protein
MKNVIQVNQSTVPDLTSGHPEQGAEKLVIAEWT